MNKGTYQHPPRTLKDLLHSNVWWADGLELINNILTYARAHELYCNIIQCVNNIWDTQHRSFLTWDGAQIKFNLTTAKK